MNFLVFFTAISINLVNGGFYEHLFESSKPENKSAPSIGGTWDEIAPSQSAYKWINMGESGGSGRETGVNGQGQYIVRPNNKRIYYPMGAAYFDGHGSSGSRIEQNVSQLDSHGFAKSKPKRKDSFLLETVGLGRGNQYTDSYGEAGSLKKVYRTELPSPSKYSTSVGRTGSPGRVTQFINSPGGAGLFQGEWDAQLGQSESKGNRYIVEVLVPAEGFNGDNQYITSHVEEGEPGALFGEQNLKQGGRYNEKDYVKQQLTAPTKSSPSVVQVVSHGGGGQYVGSYGGASSCQEKLGDKFAQNVNNNDNGYLGEPLVPTEGFVKGKKEQGGLFGKYGVGPKTPDPTKSTPSAGPGGVNQFIGSPGGAGLFQGEWDGQLGQSKNKGDRYIEKVLVPAEGFNRDGQYITSHDLNHKRVGGFVGGSQYTGSHGGMSFVDQNSKQNEHPAQIQSVAPGNVELKGSGIYQSAEYQVPSDFQYYFNEPSNIGAGEHEYDQLIRANAEHRGGFVY